MNFTKMYFTKDSFQTISFHKFNFETMIEHKKYSFTANLRGVNTINKISQNHNSNRVAMLENFVICFIFMRTTM